ncbi:hypothetical protein HPULCUR_011268 [Helicostylum pulchrum]|uniref:RNA polymerase II-associated protein 1 n=1 Tax=Helicostylum pulchrum TaxID=562976 RepID=A0ABP9YFK8_9FUNG
MSKFTRPTFNVDDDDLERLQQEFFDKEQMPSAKVYRKSAPVMDTPKRSLFAERLAASEPASEKPVMPTLESAMPSLEETPMPSLEDSSTSHNTRIEEEKEESEYEPVMDPNPEPHVPVTKKMIDLTSLLGKVLGDITEHDVKEVKAPSLPNMQEKRTSRGQKDGFPKPVHRSEFKKRLEAEKMNKSKSARVDQPPQVASQNPALLNNTLFDNENDQRINGMSEQELAEAREEIMSTLSPESIALLMKGLKAKSNKENKPEEEAKLKKEKKVCFEQQVQDKDDLLEMKRQYYADVPAENEKLAWMDNRFLTADIKAQEAKRLKELEFENNEAHASEAEKVYRKVRFDLQGHIIDQNKDISVYKGLHHHGDEPEKAGYTLAELFYLARSQVPSQRSMVLTTLGRIIKQAKMHKDQVVWTHVLTVFTAKEHSASIYLRSALDDRNLIVLVSAIDALSALVLDDEAIWEQSLLHADEFNKFLGHLVRPILPPGVSEMKRKGLNDKLTELVDRVRQTSGQNTSTEEEQRDDAALAERDLMRGLIKMDILPRIRYLLSGDLVEMDPASVERLVRILVRLAEAGQDVCEVIEEEELLEPVILWGLINTKWPMTDEVQHNKSSYPSLASVRLLTVLAQGSKQIAESIVEKATITLRFLVSSPDAACHSMKQRAYALQLETLKLIRVLACYGFIVPTLEDLHEPVMSWLRACLSGKCTELDSTRAATAIGLLEVLLHCAADPHKTTPAHAIDWHQPTSYLFAVTAVLRASRAKQDQSLYESALGYLGAWATYLNKFTNCTSSDIEEIWKAVIEEDANFESGNSVALGYTTTTNHVLRYIQFIVAYASLKKCVYSKDAYKRLLSAQLIHWLKQDYAKNMLSRYAFWLWLKHCKEKEKCWGMSLGLAELESGMRGTHTGTVETWLAQDLLQLCLSTKTLGDLTASLGPFYFEHDENNVAISKSIFELDGRLLKTFMYTRKEEENQVENQALSTLEASAFILSPIDGLYHLDKSKVAQRIQDDAATVVANTMELSTKLFYTSDIDHDVAIITMMKIFLIGDREGRMAGMESEREIFWDDRVSKDISQWLDYLCRIKTNLAGLEKAWRRSSEYIRQAQVPFFQFYQSFVAQYAAVSFGHHGFARLLVYLVTQIDVIDYRHLIFSDYRDILPTLKVTKEQVPPLTVKDWEQLSNAGLKLL